MSTIQYVAHARATLNAGHTAGTLYEIDVDLMAFDESYNSPKTQHRALDGTTETILKRIDTSIAITIGPFDTNEKPFIIEFIQSVAGGEAFTVDVDGTPGVSVNPINVKLSDKSNSETRLGNRLYSLSLGALVL